MELRQLEYFVAVVDEANFTRAAAKLHVAQPGVSAQVRRLEREFGEKLLDRSGRKVRPTAVGEAVLPYARAALAAVEGARSAVDELAGLVRGRVAIGTVASISSTALDVPELLADFHRDHPSVEITLSEDNSKHMISALRDGRLDAAFIGLASTEEPPGIETRFVYEDPLVVAVSRGDPLAGRSSIALEEVRGRDIIGLPRGTGLRFVMEDACAVAGFEPRVTFEATNPDILTRLVGRGLGVAILPESLVNGHPEEVHTIAIAGQRPRGLIALAWRKEEPMSPAARSFIELAHARLPDTAS